MLDTIELTAYSRLHFGLMEICPGQPNCYGGIGVMVDRPSMILRAEMSAESLEVPEFSPSSIDIIAEDYWQPRMRTAIQIWQAQYSDAQSAITKLELAVPPHPHVGLGSGTQLACSVSEILSRSIGPMLRFSPNSTSRIANIQERMQRLERESGRGKRSHIGMAGFLYGGCVFDRGQHQDKPRVEVLELPESWRFVLWCDHSYRGDSGDEEASIFHKCSLTPNPNRSKMLSLIEDEILPSIRASNWLDAGTAIGRYGAWAGEIFSPMQGGIYRSPEIAAKISMLESLGIHGVGHSSWGPTIYALVQDEEQARWLLERLGPHIGPMDEIHVAKAAPAAQ